MIENENEFSHDVTMLTRTSIEPLSWSGLTWNRHRTTQFEDICQKVLTIASGDYGVST